MTSKKDWSLIQWGIVVLIILEVIITAYAVWFHRFRESEVRSKTYTERLIET